jgi:hypothetical protein
MQWRLAAYLPGEVGLDVLLVQLQHLVVADHPGVGEVPDAGQAAPGHLNGQGQELVQDGHTASAD